MLKKGFRLWLMFRVNFLWLKQKALWNLRIAILNLILLMTYYISNKNSCYWKFKKEQ